MLASMKDISSNDDDKDNNDNNNKAYLQRVRKWYKTVKEWLISQNKLTFYMYIKANIKKSKPAILLI